MPPTTATAPKPTKPAKKPAAKKPEREKVYPTPQVIEARGDDAITVDKMKELLGWTEEKETEEFGEDFFLLDGWGKKVRLTKNDHNRPWNREWSLELAQKLLSKHWRFNYETFQVGEFGNVISGQHRGIGLVFAEQIRNGAPLFGGDQSAYWADYWPGEVTLETLLVLGASESADVIATLDNVKTRTFADCLYTDPTVFPKDNPKDRKTLCTMVNHTIRFLWERMGADKNATHQRRTNNESFDFFRTHPHLAKAIEFIFRVDKKKALNIKELVSQSMAAGMLYLMGADGPKTDGDDYRQAVLMGEQSEKKIDWAMWDSAKDFWTRVVVEWTKIAENDTEGSAAKEEAGFWPLKEAIANLNDLDGGFMSTKIERMALLGIAWKLFKEGEEMDCENNLFINFTPPDKHGARHMELSEYPILSPIDMGEELSTPAVDETPDDATGETGDTGGVDDPDALTDEDREALGDEEDDPAEIKARAAAEKKRGLAATLDDQPAPVKAAAEQIKAAAIARKK